MSEERTWARDAVRSETFSCIAAGGLNGDWYAALDRLTALVAAEAAAETCAEHQRDASPCVEHAADLKAAQEAVRAGLVLSAWVLLGLGPEPQS